MCVDELEPISALGERKATRIGYDFGSVTTRPPPISIDCILRMLATYVVILYIVILGLAA
jgi:hypothetical protein